MSLIKLVNTSADILGEIDGVLDAASTRVTFQHKTMHDIKKDISGWYSFYDEYRLTAKRLFKKIENELNAVQLDMKGLPKTLGQAATSSLIKATAEYRILHSLLIEVSERVDKLQLVCDVISSNRLLVSSLSDLMVKSKHHEVI